MTFREIPKVEMRVSVPVEVAQAFEVAAAKAPCNRNALATLILGQYLDLDLSVFGLQPGIAASPGKRRAVHAR